MTDAAQTVLPRWRGFNLLEMFSSKSQGDFHEDDFRWMTDWGFDFARLPMCYSLWIEDGEIYNVKESMLEKVDRAIELGRKPGVHVSLNFPRAPGYSVSRERDEPFDLWKDREALAAFCFHWQLFAKRYRSIPSDQLSFDLVNEPGLVPRDDHEQVIRAAVKAIRTMDPQRLIIIDGLRWGREPCPELADLGIAQSCRAYDPMVISHYRATWVGGEKFPEPVWPGVELRGEQWDRTRLEKHYEPWVRLARQGVGVHCGEGGAFNKTPHGVFLRWFRDVLGILTSRGIGYALWNFRGSFGVLDSGRQDVDYENWHGHKLDRKLLSLLQEF